MKTLENIVTAREGDTLTMTVDMATILRPSASGKTELVATTGGAVPVANVNGRPVYLNLTAYVYPEQGKA